jgi:hypothetical protein
MAKMNQVAIAEAEETTNPDKKRLILLKNGITLLSDIIHIQERKNGRIKIFSTLTGEPITQRTFSKVNLFNSSFLRVRMKGGWGLIDFEGRTVLPCIYKSIGLREDSGMVYLTNRRGKSSRIELPSMEAINHRHIRKNLHFVGIS